MFNGTVFSWDAYKDQRTYTSTNEAEFPAMYQAARSTVYFSELMKFAGVEVYTPIEIECDNQGAVNMAEKSVHWDSRDVQPEHLKVIQLTKDEAITEMKIDGEENPADLLTKPLEHEKFRRHLYALGLAGYDESFQ